MHCFKCGATLPPGAATCPACGAATPYNVTASTPEAFNARPDPAVPGDSGEEKVPPPVLSQAEETPQVERTVLQQAPQPEVAESKNVERTELQEPPAQGTPAPQAAVERTVLEQPPQPAPPSSSPAWQQPKQMQGLQPGPQPFPGQQPPQQGPWQPQQGPSQPFPWPQFQQQWPQPLPWQQPQQGQWQPQPGMPQPMPWQQPPQQAQPFPGQQPSQQGPWQPQPGMAQPFPGQQGQLAAPQSYPAWQQPGAVQPQQGQSWPQPFMGQPQPAGSQPLQGQSWPQPFSGQPQFQPSPAWQWPQMSMAQPVPAQQISQATPAPAAQALPAQQAPEHQGLSLEMILLLIIIALVVIGGSGLLYYVAAAHPANLHAQATSVAQDFLTAQSRSMSPEVIYTQATSDTPTINDSLSNPANSTWHNTNSAGGSCTFSQGALHISVQKDFANFCYSSMSFSNFVFQVQVNIIKGSIGGLIFRADESSLRHYLFGINTNGFYTLDVLTSNSAKLLNYGPSAAIKTELGQPNLLTVIARGSTMYLYINKQFVARASDSTLSSGSIGLFATNHTGSIDVAFNNAQVWKL